MVSGGIGGIPEAPTTLCNLANLDTNPFPTICSTTILLSGTTLCDAGQPSPPASPCVAGQLTQDGFDFGAVVPALVGGEIVIDQLTGLTASITAAPAPGDNFLLLTDIDGGLATLETNGTGFQIVSGGAVSNPTCINDGFAYTNTGNSFSIQAPCIQYLPSRWNSTQEYISHAIRYFNFLSFSSTASYLQGCKFRKFTFQ